MSAERSRYSGGRDPYIATAAKCSILAGPIFLVCLAMSALVGPEPVTFSALKLGGALIGSVWLLIISAVIGFLLAFIPILVGCATLYNLGKLNFVYQLQPVWFLVGGTSGLLIAASLGFPQPFSTALALTGASCASVARTYVRWR